jgi:hypothetical protein
MGLILPDFGAEHEAPSGFFYFFIFSHDAPVDTSCHACSQMGILQAV